MAKKKTNRKNTSAKSNVTKTVVKKAAAKKAAPKRKATPKSIDGIMAAYKKERVKQTAGLAAARKKIQLLSKQVGSMKQQLESLKKEAVETEVAIETIDSRRDKEIGTLLASLGVDLDTAASASKRKPVVDRPTPLFDASPDKENEADAKPE